VRRRPFAHLRASLRQYRRSPVLCSFPVLAISLLLFQRVRTAVVQRLLHRFLKLSAEHVQSSRLSAPER
jgi:hypothetical protein